MQCSFCLEAVIRPTQAGHHRTKRSKGGQDFPWNMSRICTRCHALVHHAEQMFLKGVKREDVFSYLCDYLLKIRGIDAPEVAEFLCDAGLQAAETEDDSGRKFAPVEVKVPVGMLQDFTLLASDCHVTRNALILWAMRELLEGRSILPKG